VEPARGRNAARHPEGHVDNSHHPARGSALAPFLGDERTVMPSYFPIFIVAAIV
jgi:hypothetical protein